MIIFGSLESAQTCVNRTFFARCYRSGATSEYRFKIGDLAPTAAAYPKF